VAVDPHQPVLIGTGQLSNRVDDGAEPLEPTDLIAEALRRAGSDTGVAGAMATADTVGIVSMLSWRYRDPGALVAQRLGLQPARSLYTTPGGQSPQQLVNLLARDIAEGRSDLAVVGGAEAWRTRQAHRGTEAELGWTPTDESVAKAEAVGPELDMIAPEESEIGLFMPVQMYPMFDVALRASLGLSGAAHVERICSLWSRFSEVAATNPDAWIQKAFTSDELQAVTADNRLIGWPYRKLLVSNNMVEQGAGLVLCSVEKAQALGIPRDRWVFLHSGADGADTTYVSHRGYLHTSPAIRVVGRAALDLAGAGPDDLDHVDLYSCFPSAVQIAAIELGLDVERPLTVTGGMSFAGGPWNNYATHGIATMARVLREDPGALGLCTANGGYLTKHAMGVYGTEPPAAGFRWANPQAEIDAFPRRGVVAGHKGAATVESATVVHGREGSAERAFAACLLPDGRRAWAASSDADLMAAIETEEVVGRAAQLDGEAGLSFS
jgi:acetyl-CoA C-acetyltransferase